MQKQETLTKNQKIILDLIEKSDQPLKAYSILFDVKKKGINAPLQVYRALNKLVKIGKIHKCQIANATIFSICESCEDVTEIHDHKLSEHLRDFKDNKGMKYNKYNLEFFGLCKKCV